MSEEREKRREKYKRWFDFFYYVASEKNRYVWRGSISELCVKQVCLTSSMQLNSTRDIRDVHQTALLQKSHQNCSQNSITTPHYK